MLVRSKFLCGGAIVCGLFASALASNAFALPEGASAAVLVQAASSNKTAIIDGREWRCTDTNCSASPSLVNDVHAPSIECARVAEELGAFASYTTGSIKLNDKQLASCNAYAPRQQTAEAKTH